MNSLQKLMHHFSNPKGAYATSEWWDKIRELMKEEEQVTNQLKNMAKKKTVTDADLVASKEKFENEVKYIAKAFKIPIKVVRQAVNNANKSGKPCRSRKRIYEYLRALGYVIKTKKY